jgi:hypothetical protein
MTSPLTLSIGVFPHFLSEASLDNRVQLCSNSHSPPPSDERVVSASAIVRGGLEHESRAALLFSVPRWVIDGAWDAFIPELCDEVSSEHARSVKAQFAAEFQDFLVFLGAPTQTPHSLEVCAWTASARPAGDTASSQGLFRDLVVNVGEQPFAAHLAPCATLHAAPCDGIRVRLLPGEGLFIRPRFRAHWYSLEHEGLNLAMVCFRELHEVPG